MYGVGLANRKPKISFPLVLFHFVKVESVINFDSYQPLTIASYNT